MRNVPVHRIVAAEMRTAYGEDPKYTALIASSDKEDVEVVFDTFKAPILASSILKSSQQAMKEVPPEEIVVALAKNLETSMGIIPDLVDISLAAEGEVLCLNFGPGAMFLRLTGRAKNALKDLCARLG